MNRKTARANTEAAFPTEVCEQQIAVPFAYPVYFTHDVLNPANPVLKSVLIRQQTGARPRAAVCIDSGLHEAWPRTDDAIEAYFRRHKQSIELAGEPVIVPGGEWAKNGWAKAQELVDYFAGLRLCRHSFVVVLGGGGVTDVVGFASALVHRGVRLVRLPTTVIGQNDVGVGVKNGINLQGRKNMVGTFAPPFAVINDLDYLRTLKTRDWIGGIAEAFKVAIIRDAEFFDYLCTNAAALRGGSAAVMQTLVKQCARLHLAHIREGGDPFEQGMARPMDFGHWAAHRLEAMSGYAVGHGQAVAIGIALDSYYASRQGFITNAELALILKGLKDCGLPVWSELLEQRNAEGRLEILDGFDEFREHIGGELTLTMPVSIGARREIHTVDLGVVEQGLAFLKDAFLAAAQP